jgi:hypothetical protein
MFHYLVELFDGIRATQFSNRVEWDILITDDVIDAVIQL